MEDKYTLLDEKSDLISIQNYIYIYIYIYIYTHIVAVDKQ
jgi:hypothetical protein